MNRGVLRLASLAQHEFLSGASYFYGNLSEAKYPERIYLSLSKVIESKDKIM
ncbi:MAG: hypothetical protein ACYTBV_09190 [Planctomycetota bacterium]